MVKNGEKVIDFTRPLSTVRPCDACGGAHQGMLWHEIELRLAVVNASEANRNIAIFGIRGLGIAEAMMPDEPVKVSKPINLLRVCTDCVSRKPLGQLVEEADARAATGAPL